MKIHREQASGYREGETTETHPAFGMISLCRTTCNPPAILFGSSVKHGNYISITIKEAQRNSNLSHDFYFAKKELIMVTISGTQLGDMLCSMNVGEGVPCTIERFNGESRPEIEEFSTIQKEAQEQMAENLDRVFEKSRDLIERAKGILQKGATKKSDREELLSVLTQLSHGVGSNLKFAGECFDKKVEKMVNQAKGEVESFISAKIHSAGLQALGGKPLVEIEG